MSAKGWACIHRSIFDNWLWESKPFSRGQAWIDLILLANHEDGFIIARGISVDIKRGQVGWSARKLSTRWGWSRDKVDNFLNLLEIQQQIEPQKNNVTTVITIVNYEKYQNFDPQNEPQIDPQKSHRLIHRKATEKPQTGPNNNVNNDNNNTYDGIAEKIYQLYPRKEAKPVALKAIQKALKKIDADLLIKKVDEYSLSVQGKDQQYIPHPATWFNQERWNDVVTASSSYAGQLLNFKRAQCDIDRDNFLKAQVEEMWSKNEKQSN